jgi:hypothetical protein
MYLELSKSGVSVAKQITRYDITEVVGNKDWVNEMSF